MHDDWLQARTWAEEEFGSALLGDARRTERLVRMATQAALAPSGRITRVFNSSAEQQGAYDFLESPHVLSSALQEAMARTAALRSATHAFVYVPVDGTSLHLTDRQRSKGFGAIGPYERRARGLKVIHALAISPAGVPLGFVAQTYWSRQDSKKAPAIKRKVHEKETQHWLTTLSTSLTRMTLHAPTTRCWFQIDREGDSASVLKNLVTSGALFTVRSSSNRRLQTGSPRREYLRGYLGCAPSRTHYQLQVPGRPKRAARSAHMVVRASPVTLRLHNKWTHSCSALSLNAVWARERGTAPPGEEPIDWLLLTNHSIQTPQDLNQILFGYAQRWRIEEVHKTWKSGACKVEQTQLRSSEHVQKWATILAAVAVRIERLKYISRTEPNQPASVELSDPEVQALILLKRKQKKRTETIPDTMPTLGQATLWLAELGGYTGKSSGGPPGSITIQRGLERLEEATEVLECPYRTPPVSPTADSPASDEDWNTCRGPPNQ
jgi:hypothetical protein